MVCPVCPWQATDPWPVQAPEAFGIGTDHPEFNALREEFFTNYEHCLLDTTYAFPGVSQLLNAIELAGLRWGIVTNKSSRFTNPLVGQMPLLAGASVVISGDTTAHTKPHPEPLLEAARRLSVAPADCIYIGDDQRDIQAAIAAQMPGYAACWGYMGETDVSTWGAQALLAQPVDLLPILSLGERH